MCTDARVKPLWHDDDDDDDDDDKVKTGQGGNITILWNQQIQTDSTIPNNKPDIIICDNEIEHVC
jgi:hypothetical protein